MPPGTRCSPAPATTVATRASPSRPPSRYSYAGTPGSRGRDDERRIRHDAVEALPRHRLEQAAEPELDAVDAVELGVEPGELEGALRDVGRDDPRGPAPGVQGLDAASGSEVEHRVDAGRAAAGRSASPRRRRRPSTWSTRSSRPVRELAEVARDPPLAGSRACRVTVRAAGRRAAGRVPLDREQREVDAPVTPSSGRRGIRVVARDRLARARRARRAWRDRRMPRARPGARRASGGRARDARDAGPPRHPAPRAPARPPP